MSYREYISENKGEFQLDYYGEEPLSRVEFAPGSNQLLSVASWDGSLALAHLPSNTVRLRRALTAPILDTSFGEPNQIYAGLLDHSVRLLDLETGEDRLVGRHEAAVRTVDRCTDLRCVLTGGWDSNVTMWDLRTPRSLATFRQPDLVYALAVCGDKFIVGTKERKICIWDLRNVSCVLQKRESNLKYQTRSLAAFPDKERFVVGSIEGRVAVEYLDSDPEAQRNKYAFKCHRLKEGQLEKIYPVNSISFHSKHTTFATGGGDGYVNMWDSGNKKRICQFHKYPNSVSSLAFSGDGSVLAIACCFLFDIPEPTIIRPSSVFIRFVSDLETKPK